MSYLYLAQALSKYRSSWQAAEAHVGWKGVEKAWRHRAGVWALLSRWPGPHPQGMG